MQYVYFTILFVPDVGFFFDTAVCLFFKCKSQIKKLKESNHTDLSFTYLNCALLYCVFCSDNTSHTCVQFISIV